MEEKLNLYYTNKKYLLILFIGVLTLLACKTEYTKYVESEYKKGIRYDSLIFGLRINQPMQAFFDTCTELNKKKLITQGGSMAYFIGPDLLIGDTTHKKDMHFYAIRDQHNTIKGMRFLFDYQGWAIWNQHLSSDSLIVELQNKFLKDYPGNEFMKLMVGNNEKPIFVKVDGNRHIQMSAIDSRQVEVKIEDTEFKFKSLKK